MLSNEFFPLSEYTKIYVGCGFAPDPTEGAYSAPQTPLLVQGATSRHEGNGGKGREGLGEGEWRGK